ncbi:lysophospholipid acyltransferase family protein [Synoicihabitans lomoniglobus]|uniref:Lysophospholipid acyltransferase family protein n=1 Tax=Synoicihabitans lomoniglobus TaxID=2909285 RepID=A0AAE9ZWE6_9BACT|nr:lysophospholipid acyltransferase family protein [Opitutaceae bacterium LMO-M01]
MPPQFVSPPIPWRLSLRTIWRLVGVLTVAAGAGLSYLFVASNRRTIAGRAAWLQRTCQHVLRRLRVEVKSVGSLPAGVMLTPNHVSYLDILVLNALTPTVFVSKAEVKGWPLFGWFAQKAGTLFLRREVRADLVRVGAQLEPVVASGVNLAVFLEGTSSDGRGVRPFKPGMLAPAVAAGWPVAPATLHYAVPTGRDAAVAVAWWGTMPLLPHLLTLTGLPWIKATVEWGKTRSAGGDRKALAAALQSEVAAGLARAYERG